MSGACHQPGPAGKSVTQKSLAAGPDTAGLTPDVPPVRQSLGNAARQRESHVISVSGESFPSEVLHSEIPVVVDFYASWCPPCRALAPILDRLAGEFAGRIKFVQIDSDQEEQLAASWNIDSLPTILVFENGQNLGQFSGLPDENQLRDQLQKWVASPPDVPR